MSDKLTRKAIYIGRRLGRGDKTFHVFLLLPKKKEMWYGKIQRVWIGHTYGCWPSQMSRRPPRLDDERIDNPEWDAADALVTAHLSKKRADVKAKRNVSPAIKKAVEAIKPLIEKTSWIEQEALVKHLVNLARDKK